MLVVDKSPSELVVSNPHWTIVKQMYTIFRF